MAQLASPASSISRKSRWRSIASGGRARRPPLAVDACLDRPEQPGRRPAAARTRVERNALVVLPLVPVTPATCSSSVGRPKNSSAATAIAARARRRRRAAALRVERPLDDERDRAVRDRLGREIVPVARMPGTQKNRPPARPRVRRRRGRGSRPERARRPPPAERGDQALQVLDGRV